MLDRVRRRLPQPVRSGRHRVDALELGGRDELRDPVEREAAVVVEQAGRLAAVALVGGPEAAQRCELVLGVAPPEGVDLVLALDVGTRTPFLVFGLWLGGALYTAVVALAGSLFRVRG